MITAVDGFVLIQNIETKGYGSFYLVNSRDVRKQVNYRVDINVLTWWNELCRGHQRRQQLNVIGRAAK